MVQVAYRAVVPEGPVEEAAQLALLCRDAWVAVAHWQDLHFFFWCKLYFNMFWNSNTLATWCEELTHLKRLWCWERLKTGGEGDDRGWDGWMASLIQWTWVWVNSGSWWWTGRPGVLQSMGLQRVGRNWVTELNWTEYFNIHTYL